MLGARRMRSPKGRQWKTPAVIAMLVLMNEILLRLCLALTSQPLFGYTLSSPPLEGQTLLSLIEMYSV